MTVQATGQHILWISCPTIKDWWCILQLVLSNPDKLLNYKAQVKTKLKGWLHLVQPYFVILPALDSKRIFSHHNKLLYTFWLFNANFTHINFWNALPWRVVHCSPSHARQIQNFLKRYPCSLSLSPWEDIPYSWPNSPHSMHSTDNQVPNRGKGRKSGS